jgi:hypothetical protein
MTFQGVFHVIFDEQFEKVTNNVYNSAHFIYTMPQSQEIIITVFNNRVWVILLCS